MILEALRRNERTVSEIGAIVGGSQSNVSQHLRIMRDREILTSRKEGSRVYYALAGPSVCEILDSVKDLVCRA